MARQILFQSPHNNTNVRALLAALLEAEQLYVFHTTVAVQPDAWYLSGLPQGLSRELRRRAFSLAPDQVCTHPWRSLLNAVITRTPLASRLPEWLSGYRIGRAMDRAIAAHLQAQGRPEGLAGIYAYEDSAAYTFRVAKELGLKCFYEQPIGYWQVGQRIQKQEAELNPAWATTMPAIDEPTDKLALKEEELRLADTIFVASSFTRQTLLEGPEIRVPVHVVPYGAPVIEIPERPPQNPSGRLKVLFVGSLGQRKGLSYLLEAARWLQDQIDLTLIGFPVGECPELTQALQTHRWLRSIPHQEVLGEMQRHDVFVFPSLFEGFGLVILEALACGLPVITTPHTAGPDVILEGEDGFIVPIRSPEAIAARLEVLIQDRQRLHHMSQTAIQRSHLFSWQTYGQTAIQLIQAAVEA